MTFSEDELRYELHSAAENVHAPPHLLTTTQAGGRRRLRRRRALHLTPLAAVLTGLAMWSPHLRIDDPSRSGTTVAASPEQPQSPTSQTPQETSRQASAPLPGPAPDLSGDNSISDADMQARDAFFDAGYTYDDAVRLGALWNQDTDEAKVTGGQRLILGQSLPFNP